MAVGITIATIAVLMGGSSGGGPSHFLIDAEKQIKSVVQDKTRRKTVLAELDTLSKKLKKLGKKIEGHMNDYVRVHSDFQSTEREFDAITDLLKADQQETAKLILDTREKMREQMSKEEWGAVFDSSN